MKWATVAKFLTLGGGAVSAASLNGAFGSWSHVIATIGGALVAIGAAVASQTSAGHPDGASTIK